MRGPLYALVPPVNIFLFLGAPPLLCCPSGTWPLSSAESWTKPRWENITVYSIHGKSSVADPDLFVFGPSGSVSMRYGSGSFYHQAKIVRKLSIPSVLRLLYDFLSYLKNDVSVALKSNKKKNFLVEILKISDENSRIRSRIL
jgi:hypothetical protein